MKPGQGSRLDSWKEIAAYVGRNERTVMRWADERGFPIHRVPGGNRRTVFALTAEIDAWMLGLAEGEDKAAGPPEADLSSAEALHSGISEGQKRILHVVRDDNRGPYGNGGDSPDSAATSAGVSGIPTRNSPRVWLAVAVAAAILAAFGARAFWTTRATTASAARIDSISLNYDTLEAKDEKGRMLWSHKYERPFTGGGILELPVSLQPAVAADFFHDGRQEVVVSIDTRSGPNRTNVRLGEMDFFSGEGKQLWRYVPRLTVKFGQYEVGAPWTIADMHVVQSGDRSSVFVVEAAHTWGNSVVEELEPRTGKSRLRFVNTGTLYIVNYIEAKQGSFLVAGGFNNEWDGAALAIWDAKKPFAASPQTPGTRHECKSCEPGAPDYYFVFPRSELNRMTESYDMPVFESQVTAAGIEITIRDRWSWGKESRVYLLEGEPPFRVKSMRMNTQYQQLHKEWSDEGKLGHKYEACPELLHPLPVKLWTPGGGWTDIQLPGTKAN